MSARVRTPVRYLSAIVVVIVIAGISASTISARPARTSATTYTWSPTGWSNIRNYCPSTACGILVSVPNGTSILLHCWADGQWTYGAYWTNRWFIAGVLTRYGEDSRTVGWIHASLVQNQYWTPHC